MTVSVSIVVNGRRFDRHVEPRLLLVHFIRDLGGMTGTKVGCDTSQCGACTVLLDGMAVRSCTCLTVQADGCAVTTIEGLAPAGSLHPLQQGFWNKHGHARLTSVNTTAAKNAAGVVAVYTGADVTTLQRVPCAWLLPNANLKIAPYPAIATDTVRYVGDIVAVVVAETRQQAYDALDLIDADYTPMPPVVDPVKAAAAGAPQIHADVPGNEAFHWTVAGGDIDAAFKSADVVVKERIFQNRLIPNAMEPRATLATWAAASGELTVWNTTQNPHILRFLLSVVTGVPEDKLRVVAPEVGGGFGSKLAAYPADFLTVFCSMRLNRPVKWAE